jgi:hypothetical protein
VCLVWDGCALLIRCFEPSHLPFMQYCGGSSLTPFHKAEQDRHGIWVHSFAPMCPSVKMQPFPFLILSILAIMGETHRLPLCPAPKLTPRCPSVQHTVRFLPLSLLRPCATAGVDVPLQNGAPDKERGRANLSPQPHGRTIHLQCGGFPPQKAVVHTSERIN